MAASNGWFLTRAIKRVFAPSAAQTAHARRSPSRKPLFEAMEQRLLLSADPIGIGMAADPFVGESPS
jgi:hypothetical protein